MYHAQAVFYTLVNIYAQLIQANKNTSAVSLSNLIAKLPKLQTEVYIDYVILQSIHYSWVDCLPTHKILFA